MKKVVIDGVEYIETNETAIDKLYNFSFFLIKDITFKKNYEYSF